MERDRLARRVVGVGRNVVIQGLPRRPWQDLYHFFMTISWPRLFASYACFFLLFNLLFAALDGRLDRDRLRRLIRDAEQALQALRDLGLI